VAGATFEVVGVVNLPQGAGGGPGVGQRVDTRLPQGCHQHLAREGRHPGGGEDHLAGPQGRQLSPQIGAHVIVLPAGTQTPFLSVIFAFLGLVCNYFSLFLLHYNPYFIFSFFIYLSILSSLRHGQPGQGHRTSYLFGDNVAGK